MCRPSCYASLPHALKRLLSYARQEHGCFPCAARSGWALRAGKKSRKITCEFFRKLSGLGCAFPSSSHRLAKILWTYGNREATPSFETFGNFFQRSPQKKTAGRGVDGVESSRPSVFRIDTELQLSPNEKRPETAFVPALRGGTLPSRAMSVT